MFNNSYLRLTATGLLCILFFCSASFNSKSTALSNELASVNLLKSSITDTSWKRLTVREKIGQIMLMLPDKKKELELGYGSLKTFFQRYPVSGFFMGWKLFDGIKPQDYFNHVQQSVKEYQAASALPLLFQEDYENGPAFDGMASFPNHMALGATHSGELAYAQGKHTALECRLLGVKWVLHPVADLNLNPFNPITNIRSVSDNPDLAIRLLLNQVKGLQDNGVAATIKHFPGDGVDFRDQHITTTSNTLSMDKWWQYHGRVFQALIDSGVYTIMPGHITLPAYQTKKINGLYPPATLSEELLTGLLKGKMGFKGAIVSDAMVMGGFRGWYPDQLQGEIESFKAGVDILLWPSYGFMDTLEKKIQTGEIPIARLNDAVSRVWALKEKLGLLNKNVQLIRPMTAVEKNEAKQSAEQICENAVTLVRDRNKQLPLVPGKVKKILIIGVTPTSRKGGDGGFSLLVNLKKKLQSKGFEADLQKDVLYETQGWEETLTKTYDKLLFVVIRTPHMPFGPLNFYDDESQTAWAVNAMPKQNIIVVSLGNPYLSEEYFERVDTYINAYSNNTAMYDAVIKALCGEIKFKGISPVNLDVKRVFRID